MKRLKKLSEVERVPAWICDECDRWRLQQIREGRIPKRAELEQYRRQLERRAAESVNA